MGCHCQPYSNNLFAERPSYILLLVFYFLLWHCWIFFYYTGLFDLGFFIFDVVLSEFW